MSGDTWPNPNPRTRQMYLLLAWEKPDDHGRILNAPDFLHPVARDYAEARQVAHEALATGKYKRISVIQRTVIDQNMEDITP